MISEDLGGVPVGKTEIDDYHFKSGPIPKLVATNGFCFNQ